MKPTTHLTPPCARRWALLAAAVLAPWLLTWLPAPAQQPKKAQPADDVQEFIFLAEARPVLVRAHVRVDGAPVQAAYDDFMKHLYADLDRDGDGVVSLAEA